VIPTEFDGIFSQMRDGVASGQVNDINIIDMAGQPLNRIDELARSAQIAASNGNFGRATDIFMPQSVQTDLDIKLDPAYRVPLTDVGNGGISLGAPVVGIRTSQGNIKTNQDVFIRDGDLKTPFELRYPPIAVANATNMPATVTGAAASDPSSKFGAPEAGTYYDLVTGVNARGESTGRKSAAVTVAAGERMTLTITAAAGGTETGYVIYRSRKNGTNNTDDFREMVRIPKAGATTVFVDANRDIPGTANAYVLNMTPGHTAIIWRQFLPMMKFPLYPTVSAVIPWAQLLFGYLRISKRRHHVVIKNILPTTAQWKPFA
jgi:hypothetical protein